MNIIYFDNYRQYSGATINPSILWEYDLTHFNYHQMRDIVVQRVVERGWRADWYAALNLYGIAGMREAVKNIPYLNNKDMQFVSLIFNIPLSEMKCYTKKLSQKIHWNS